jgi:hypothetical protein
MWLLGDLIRAARAAAGCWMPAGECLKLAAIAARGSRGPASSSARPGRAPRNERARENPSPSPSASTPTNDVLRARELDWSHREMSDRMIVASALRLDLPLVTADRAIAEWGGVEVIW